MTYLVKSLDIYIKTYGDMYVECAIIYKNIGNIHYKKEDYEKALTYFEKCLEI